MELSNCSFYSLHHFYPATVVALLDLQRTVFTDEAYKDLVESNAYIVSRKRSFVCFEDLEMYLF